MSHAVLSHTAMSHTTMSHTVTLIANPAEPAVDAALVRRVSDAIGGTRTDWLCPGVAADIHTAQRAGDATAAVSSIARDRPVDFVVQPALPADKRRRKLLLADMDSTMIGQECIDELAAEAGLKDHVAAITARAMAGEIEFDGALRERVGLLKGLDVSVIDHVIATRITAAPGALQLVRTMRAHGAFTALVSGGFTAFTGPVATMIGFQTHRANRLIEEDGKLNGTVAEPILGRQAKADALISLVAERRLTPADVIAVGDGANDLAMLALAGTGVAMHAKPAVAARADARIDHGDLTALLYIQGYRHETFAA